MQNPITSITGQTLEELQAQLGANGAKKIQFHFKKDRVTVCCHVHRYIYFGYAQTLSAALAILLEKIRMRPMTQA